MSNEIAKTTPNRLEVLIKGDSIKARFNEVLGKKAPTFISSIISATKSNKALGDCEPMSVISAALQAAALDLPIDGSLGFAHIIPYSGVAQFQLGWKAFVQLAMRSGQYKTIHPSIIYEGQIVKQNSFTGEMEFKEEKLSNTAVGYLLYFKLLNGFEKFFYMTKDEVEAHGKRYSQMYKMGKGFWKSDFDAMALKTVIKLGMSKFGVLSVDMQKAIKTDEGVIDVETEEIKYPDAPMQEQPKEASTTSERLGQVIEAVAETVQAKPHDSSKDKVWKDKITIATNLHDLNEVLKQIPESEQSPEISEHYSACYKMLASAKAPKK